MNRFSSLSFLFLLLCSFCLLWLKIHKLEQEELHIVSIVTKVRTIGAAMLELDVIV